MNRDEAFFLRLPQQELDLIKARARVEMVVVVVLVVMIFIMTLVMAMILVRVVAMMRDLIFFQGKGKGGEHC